MEFNLHIKKEKPFEGIATFSSECRQEEGQVCKRPIRGKKLRKRFTKHLENISSVKYEILKLAALPNDAKELGNRDGVPTVRASLCLMELWLSH